MRQQDRAWWLLMGILGAFISGLIVTAGGWMLQEFWGVAFWWSYVIAAIPALLWGMFATKRLENWRIAQIESYWSE